MIVSAGYLRAMKIEVPQDIPDCAMTTMPIPSAITSSYNEETRTITLDMNLDFITPFAWLTLDIVITKKYMSRNKREGKFIGRVNRYNPTTRKKLKPQLRQGTGLFKDFPPLGKIKSNIQRMIAQGY